MTLRRVLAGVGAATLISVVIVLATPAPQATGARLAGYEYLESFTSNLVINSDGTVDVTEELTARFSRNDGHGIIRELITEQAYPPKPHTKRVYDITNVEVTAQPGVATDTSFSQVGDTLSIRIGRSDRTVPAGLWRYTLRYTIGGALNHFSDHDELYWNVTGNDWNRINRVSITQEGPVPFTRIACFAGPYGSTRPCTSADLQPDGRAEFTNDALVYGGVTTVVALPLGVITPPPTPILEDTRFDLMKALRLTPLTLSIAFVELLALCGAIITIVVIRGRDRQSAGTPVDQAFATSSEEGSQPVPYFARREIPVEFVPPDDLRPGLLGVLVEEEASTLDVTATLVDLATRGYIRIVELESTGLIFKTPDWRLDRMRSDLDGLEPFEIALLEELFGSETNSVALSALRNTFAPKLKRIKALLVSGAMQRKWFRRDPAAAASTAYWLGGAIAFVGVFTTVLSIGIPVLVQFAIPLVIAGILLMALAKYFPARTATGTATYRRALGFRRFITESEKYRAQFAERANLFTEYLPYAVVFGATTKWATTFQDLGLTPTDSPSWYYSSHPFNAVAFGVALSSFTTTSAGTMTVTPGGSGGSGFGGGGFSGGGGGGGGGGGW